MGKLARLSVAAIFLILQVFCIHDKNQLSDFDLHILNGLCYEHTMYFKPSNANDALALVILVSNYRITEIHLC